MDKFVIGGAVIIAVTLGLLFIGSKGSSSPTNEFASVESALQAGAKLYDVRTPVEYSAGHIKGANNWSLQDMQAGRLPNAPKDTKLYVYCQSGNRSAQATRLLKNAGFTNVVDLGGIGKVQRSGGSLEV